MAEAQTTIEVIALRYRPAAQVIPILQPLIASDEAITGQGYNLIVRVHPDTLAQIRTLLTRYINGQPVIAQQQAATVIEVPLGEWVELAGTNQSSAQQQSGILSTARRDGQTENSIWLKVELLEH